MTSLIPAQIRERAVAAIESGVSRHDVAHTLGVSLRSVERWLQKARRHESLADRPPSGRPPVVSPDKRPRLLAWATAHPEATLAEIAVAWEADSGRRVSLSTLSRLLRRAGLTRKK